MKHHTIEVDDQVLLKQQQTKNDPPYDPEPYQVVDIHGHQITASRGDRILTRDAQKWKAIHLRSKPNYASENDLGGFGAGRQEDTHFPAGEPSYEGETTTAGVAQQNASSSGAGNAHIANPSMEVDVQDNSVERGTHSFADEMAVRRPISGRSTKGKKPVRYGIDD